MMFDTEECVLLQVTIRTFVRGLSGEEDTGQGPLNSIVRKSNDSRVSDTCPQMKWVSVKLS